jgi:hypothetical protein
VVEDHPQPRVGHPVDHPRVPREQAVVGDVLEEERRQHEARGALRLHAVAGEGDRLGERGAAGGGHDPRGRDARGEKGIEAGLALGERERLALAGGAERRHAVDALRQQPGGVPDEAGAVDSAGGVEGCQHRAPQAADREGIRHARELARNPARDCEHG